MAGNSEFLTETAAENRPFISLDIDFFYIYIQPGCNGVAGKLFLGENDKSLYL